MMEPWRFKPGQVWTYDNRDGEEDSRAVILRIDEEDGVRIFHICVRGLQIRDPYDPNARIDTITHMPFAADAAMASLKELDRVGAIPNFSEGYANWRTAYERREAGVFTISIGQAVAYMAGEAQGDIGDVLE